MKKLTIIALIAMMLIGMLAFTACKTEVQETQDEMEQLAEDTEAAIDEAVEEAVEDIETITE